MFLAGVAGSMTNTVLVMGMAYLFFAEPYANATNITVEGVLKAVATVMVINGTRGCYCWYNSICCVCFINGGI